MSNLAMMMGLGSAAGGGTPWLADLSVASYVAVIATNSQEATPEELFFKPDGTVMYLIGGASNSIHQYALSTAWDLSSASFSQSKNYGNNSPFEGEARSVFFKPDGTKMYIAGIDFDNIYEWDLSTAWDISTASLSQYASTQSTDPEGLWFSPDGTKMFTVQTTDDNVDEYTLSTAWDISTKSGIINAFSVASQDSLPQSVSFSPDGTKMYITGRSSDTIYQYSLATGFDLSTAAYDSISFNFNNENSVIQGSTFSSDGSNLYVIGTGSSPFSNVYQYTTA